MDVDQLGGQAAAVELYLFIQFEPVERPNERFIETSIPMGKFFKQKNLDLARRFSRRPKSRAGMTLLSLRTTQEPGGRYFSILANMSWEIACF